MKRTCSNCGQSYDTANIPESADHSVCLYCKAPVTMFAKPSAASSTGKKSNFGQVIRLVIIMVVIAGPAILKFFDVEKKVVKKDEASAVHSAPAAAKQGFHMMEGQERYFDKAGKYTDKTQDLVNAYPELEFDPHVTFAFSNVTQSNFNLFTSHAKESKKEYSFGAMPPLHRAARSGDAKKVRELVDSGMEVNLPDQYGNTALEWAEHMQKADVVDLLKEKGAKESQ